MSKKRSGGGLSPTQQAAKFLGVSVLAGAVLAGIALPVEPETGCGGAALSQASENHDTAKSAAVKSCLVVGNLFFINWNLRR